MFREMRRPKQMLPEEMTQEILKKATSGVLSVIGDDGYPYGVPISFSYVDGKIYFHCARTGHKLDAIKNNDKVSFCIITKDDVHLDEYTTYYRSVVAFGRAKIMETDEEKLHGMRCMMQKYPAPFPQEVIEEKMKKELPAFTVVEITIEHCTGKEATDLANARHGR